MTQTLPSGWLTGSAARLYFIPYLLTFKLWAPGPLTTPLWRLLKHPLPCPYYIAATVMAVLFSLEAWESGLLHPPSLWWILCIACLERGISYHTVDNNKRLLHPSWSVISPSGQMSHTLEGYLLPCRTHWEFESTGFTRAVSPNPCAPLGLSWPLLAALVFLHFQLLARLCSGRMCSLLLAVLLLFDTHGFTSMATRGCLSFP